MGAVNRVAVVAEIGSVRGGSRAPLELAQALAQQGPATFFARSVDADARADLERAGVTVETGGPAELRQLLRSGSFLGVSTHTRAGLLLAAVRAHRNVVATYHGTQQGVVSERMYPRRVTGLPFADILADAAVFAQQALLWRLPHRVVSISKAAANELRRRYHRTGPVVPWGAYPSVWHPAPTTPEHPTLLSVSRFTPYKRFDDAIAVHRTLRQWFPDLRLVLAGAAVNAPYLVYLRSIAGPGVEFTLDPDDATLQELYRRASLYLSFDRFPFFGMTLLEAQAFGVPVVARDHLAVRENLRHGESGFAIRSVAEAEQRCQELLTDTDRWSRFSHAARAWAATFTWDRTADGYWKVLNG